MLKKREPKKLVKTLKPLAKPLLVKKKPLRKLPKKPLVQRHFPRDVKMPKALGTRTKSGTHTFTYAQRPDHPAFKEIRMSASLLDKTTYEVDFKNNLVVAITTTEPDGIKVGWNYCGYCKQSVNVCECSRLVPPTFVIRWMPKIDESEAAIIRAMESKFSPSKKLSKSSASLPKKAKSNELSRITNIEDARKKSLKKVSGKPLKK